MMDIALDSKFTVGGMATDEFRAKGLMRVNRFVIHL